MKKSTVFLFLLVFLSKLSAQCYLQKTDVSGLDLSSYQTRLNQSACALKDSLPTEFQSQFKVIAFGFYVHSPSFVSGISQMQSLSKSQADVESPYYLLITRQSDPTGLYTKMYVDLKIPNTGLFDCVDSTKLKTIEETVQTAINEEYARTGSLHFLYSDAEIKGMEILSKIFATLRSGNCCIPSDEAVESWLTAKGFVKLDIEGTNFNNPKVLGPISAKPDPVQKRSNDYVTDFANLLVQVNNQSLNLKVGVNEVLETNYSANSPKFFILKNQSICNGEFETAITELSQNLPNIRRNRLCTE